MKLFTLIKIAKGWFGDTRNFIRLLDSKKINIKHTGNETGLKLRPYKDHFFVNVHIPKKNNLDEIEKKIPRTTLLFHEGSHALHLLKTKPFQKRIINFNKVVKKNIERLPEKRIKDERIANNLALNHITNKSDRKKYLKKIKTGYNDYKIETKFFGNNENKKTILNKKHWVR